MSASDGTEFPPLWPAGFHPVTVAQIQERCVDEFDLSKKRKGLMDGFRSVIDCLLAAGITCEIWLDGSFTTAKIDPSDIDFIAVVDARLYDQGTEEQRSALDALTDGTPGNDLPIGCDTNVAYVDPPEYAGALNVLSYWQRRFGFSKFHQTPKGIVTVKLVATTPEQEATKQGKGKPAQQGEGEPV